MFYLTVNNTIEELELDLRARIRAYKDFENITLIHKEKD